MPSTKLLSSGDLDELGVAAIHAGEPLVIAAELIDAAELGGLADKADTGYALIMAAEITEQAGDLDAAQVLAERAIEAYRLHCDSDAGYPRAFRAGLLLRLGREEEAMAELTALRPLMTTDLSAASYVGEALQSAGRDETAEQWLTAALQEALERWTSDLDSDQPRQSAIVYCLSVERHGLRRDLDLPHDNYDDLADRLLDVVEAPLPAEEDGVIPALFWPQAEFEQVLLRWPVLADVFGGTWDEHRALLEEGLAQWSEEGRTGLSVIAGTPDELASWATQRGGEPTESEVWESYVEHLEGRQRETPWPPGRNEPCWCQSGLKYKKCCLPRSRP